MVEPPLEDREPPAPDRGGQPVPDLGGQPAPPPGGHHPPPHLDPHAAGPYPGGPPGPYPGGPAAPYPGGPPGPYPGGPAAPYPGGPPHPSQTWYGSGYAGGSPAVPGTVRAARVIAWIQGVLWGLLAFSGAMNLLFGSEETLAGRDTAYRAGWFVGGLLIVGLLIALSTATIRCAVRLGQGRRSARTWLIVLEIGLVLLAALIIAIGLAVAVGGPADAAPAGVAVAVIFTLIGMLPTSVIILLTRSRALDHFTAYPHGDPTG